MKLFWRKLKNACPKVRNTKYDLVNKKRSNSESNICTTDLTTQIMMIIERRVILSQSYEMHFIINRSKKQNYISNTFKSYIWFSFFLTEKFILDSKKLFLKTFRKSASRFSCRCDPWPIFGSRIAVKSVQLFRERQLMKLFKLKHRISPSNAMK